MEAWTHPTSASSHPSLDKSHLIGLLLLCTAATLPDA